MGVPTTFEEDNMQGKRRRALDSRGRPVPGLYVRDGRYTAGFKLARRWHMRTLSAETLTEARRERESLLAGLREGLPARGRSIATRRHSAFAQPAIRCGGGVGVRR